MDAQAEKPPFAWQPLTPGGIAAFARATWGRLFFVQFVVAVLVAGIVLWFVQTRWFSIIGTAIKALPAQSEIRAGKLQWFGDSPQSLAENNFLALCVDLKHEGTARSPAHVQVEFGQSDFRVLSLFGCRPGGYPRGWILAFNRSELEPWWGAWSPTLLAITGAGVIAGLMGVWAALALLYAPIAWLLGFLNDRLLSLSGSWRLAGAALMPGALFMSVGLCLYGFGVLDLIQLIAVTVVHIVLGWVYVVYGSLSTPVHPSVMALKNNPFLDSGISAPKSEACRNDPGSQPDPKAFKS